MYVKFNDDELAIKANCRHPLLQVTITSFTPVTGSSLCYAIADANYQLIMHMLAHITRDDLNKPVGRFSLQLIGPGAETISQNLFFCKCATTAEN